MLNIESSGRLNILRFPLIIAVIFIHNYSTDVALSGGTVGQVEISEFSKFIRNIISQGVARTAVPLFFLISGYLFFLGFKWSWNNYFIKIKSRIETLLIPFLIWNIATLAVLAVAQAMPLTQEYFSGKNALIIKFTIFDYISALFGIDRSPISYQFWFIRDLMLLVVLVPLINFFINRIPTILIGLIGVLWFSGFWPIHVPSSEAALFFSIGAVISCKEKSIFFLDEWSTPIFIIYTISLFSDIILSEMMFGPYVHRISIIFGVMTFLCLSKKVFNCIKLKESLIALSGASFFVFAAHEPILTIAKKISFNVIQPESNFLVLSMYFLIPLLLSILLVSAYRICVSNFPLATRYLTGGR